MELGRLSRACRLVQRVVGKAQRLVYLDACQGLGDDLMAYWALAAAVRLQVASATVRLHTPRPAVRAFLALLSEAVPEVEVVKEPPQGALVAVVCDPYEWFGDASVLQAAHLALSPKYRFCDPFYHRHSSVCGPGLSPRERSSRLRLLRATGRVRCWPALRVEQFARIYHGWQTATLALGVPWDTTVRTAPRLAEVWPALSGRLRRVELDGHAPRRWPALFFPAGSSWQNLGDALIDHVRGLWPALQVARYHDDAAPADVRFSSIAQAAALIQGASAVITNDTMVSHLAQMLARRHLLLCTKSPPGNVCFPGARHTRVVDLGAGLLCRPCTSWVGDRTCAAGHRRCAGQVLTRAREARLAAGIDWLRTASESDAP